MAEVESREPLQRGIRGIEQTVELIRRRIGEGGRDWAVIQHARRIVGHVAPFDYTGEIRAVFDWLTGNVRYRKDPVDAELVQSATSTLELLAGDCDDFTVIGGSLLQALGHPVYVVIAGAQPLRPGERPRFHHVYLRVRDGSSGKWVTFDPVLWNPRKGIAAGPGDEMPHGVERRWPVLGLVKKKPALRKVVVARPVARPVPLALKPRPTLVRARPMPVPKKAPVRKALAVQPRQVVAARVQTSAPKVAPMLRPPVQTSAPTVIDYNPEVEQLDEETFDEASLEEETFEEAAVDEGWGDEGDYSDAELEGYDELGSFYDTFLKPFDPTRKENTGIRTIMTLIPGGSTVVTAADAASKVNAVIAKAKAANKPAPKPPAPKPAAPAPKPAAPAPAPIVMARVPTTSTPTPTPTTKAGGIPTYVKVGAGIATLFGVGWGIKKMIGGGRRR